ncbi:DMT family transporter [Radiobacillus sp. PE A8.2]|uniref:DMT family transporter n=1 Tax=Radiobacillus sp. PE A8.2 TaxID=3380349 RepID=UPI00388E358B
MLRLYAGLIGLSLIWGFSFIFIKVLTDAVGPWGTVFLRCLSGALLLIPFLWLKRKQIAKPLPWKHLIVVGLFNAGLPWGLIALSETQINTNTASVLNALTPICTALIGFLLFSKLLTKRQWTGIFIGFIGILILIDFNISVVFGQNFIGVGTMFIATLCYGFGSQYTQKHLRGTGLLVITTYSLIVGTVSGLIGMLITGGIPVAVEINYALIISIIGLGCLGSGVAHVLYYYLMTEGSAEFATTVTYLVPVTAMIWGFVILGEPVTSHLILGLVVIFFGIYFSNRAGKPIKEPAVRV